MWIAIIQQNKRIISKQQFSIGKRKLQGIEDGKTSESELQTGFERIPEAEWATEIFVRQW